MVFPLQEAEKSIGLAQNKAREFFGQMPGISILSLSPLLKGPEFWALLFRLLYKFIVSSRCPCPGFPTYVIAWLCSYPVSPTLVDFLALVPAFWLPVTCLNPLTNTSISPATYRILSFLLVSLSRWPVRGMSVSFSRSLWAACSLIMVLNTEW